MTTPEEIRDDPKNPDNVHLSDHTGLFLDFKPAMERYMTSLGVDKLAARSGLKRKAVNTIVPVVSNSSVDEAMLAIDLGCSLCETAIRVHSGETNSDSGYRSRTVLSSRYEIFSQTD